MFLSARGYVQGLVTFGTVNAVTNINLSALTSKANSFSWIQMVRSSNPDISTCLFMTRIRFHFEKTFR